MTEQQIRDGFEQLEGALAPPLDAVERVERRVAVRRRRRRATVAAGAATIVVGVAGAAVALTGGDDGGRTIAVDRPGPASTLVMTRPDGSRVEFPDVTVSCQPPQTGVGDPIAPPPGRIWAFSPIEAEGSFDHEDDAELTRPFVYIEGLVDKLQGDRTFTFPTNWASASDEFPLVLFVADTDGNEAASSAGPESGTVRVLEASCEPEPVLRLEVDMTLGSEVGMSTLDLAGELR